MKRIKEEIEIGMEERLMKITHFMYEMFYKQLKKNNSMFNKILEKAETLEPLIVRNGKDFDRTMENYELVYEAAQAALRKVIVDGGMTKSKEFYSHAYYV